jgi:hypothetical protein
MTYLRANGSEPAICYREGSPLHRARTNSYGEPYV